jgi:hypothetical protein
MARAKPACRPQRQTSPDRFARSWLLSGASMPQTLDRCTGGSRARSGYALSMSTSALALRGFAKPESHSHNETAAGSQRWSRQVGGFS